jgi:hypothetical protein
MSPSTLSKVERVEQNCVPFPVFPVNLQYMPPPLSCPLTKLDPHFRVPSKVPLPLNPTFRSTPTPLVHRRSWHGLTTPFFSYFLFLYFFIISSLFPYFNLFVSIFIQSYVNIKLHVSTPGLGGGALSMGPESGGQAL